MVITSDWHVGARTLLMPDDEMSTPYLRRCTNTIQAVPRFEHAVLSYDQHFLTPRYLSNTYVGTRPAVFMSSYMTVA
jgi:hypothetical protein